MSKQISVFGLGAMGAALAVKYIEHGYETTVWNRSPAKAQPLLAKGARLASTVSEGLDSSNLIVVCLLDNSAVQETLAQALSSLSGKTIVNLTNGTPSQARQLSEWITSSGAEYIHGGIMAVPDMIGLPQAVLLYSGKSPETFNGVEPHLSILGTSKFLGTDPGSASLHDLALLAGMYGLFSGFLHSTALVKSEKGTTATGFLDLLVPWLSAMTGYLGLLAKQIDERDYATQGSNLAMQAAGVENIVHASEEQGVSPRMFLPIKGLMERAVENGHGAADFSALIEYLGLESRT